jgi:hypothetical protein
MDLTISWIDREGPNWTAATGATEALWKWDRLRSSGAQDIEIKNDDGVALSREELENMAACEGSTRTE